MKDGTLEQVGTPEVVYRQPKTAYVADFLGQTNFIEAYVQNGFAQTPFGRVKVDGEAAGDALLSIRPECLKMTGIRFLEEWRKHQDVLSGRRSRDTIIHIALKSMDGITSFKPTITVRFQIGDPVVLVAVSAVPVMPETGQADGRVLDSEDTY